MRNDTLGRAAPLHWLPVASLLLALAGYEIFAPLMQAFAAESSVPAMLVRAGTIGACLWSAYLYRDRWPPIRWSLLPMLAFLVLYSFRLFDNFFVRGFEWEASPDVAFLFLIGASLIPAVLLHRLAAGLDDDTLVAWGKLAVGVFVLGMVLSWDQVLLSFVSTRLVLDKLNPISLGYVCTTLMLLLLLRPPRGLMEGLSWSAAISVMLFGMVLSQARGQLLAMVLLLPLLVVSCPKLERRRLLMLVAAPVTVFAAVVFLLRLDLADLVLDRFERIDSEDSADGRRLAWAAAWSQFIESPWIGDKVFEPTLRHYPHNIILESLIALGIPGGLLMVAHLGLTLWAIKLTLLDRAGAPLAHRFIALLAFKELVAVQLSGAVWSDNTFWIASACVLGLPHARLFRSRSTDRALTVASTSS